MSCVNAETASEKLVAALAGPAQVSGDAGSVTQHNLKDLIEADRYLKSKCAAASGGFGLVRRQIKFPGAV